MPSDSSSRIITVINRKGGVGKTHVCWLLASVAADRGQRVLVVDLDSQANITGSLLDSADHPSVERLFDPSADPDLLSLITPASNLQIDVIPSSPRLEPFNLADRADWEQADLHLSLATALTDVVHEYDYIVLDCPPNLALTSMAALCASDFVIVPLEAAHWGALVEIGVQNGPTSGG